MMIDLRQMRYFAALAETLHFGRAAERLHISQPPLTRQIAALERELGVRLLERNSRRAKLTHAGQRFLEDARLAIAAFDQACRNAQLAERGELGALAIGFMMHAAHTVLPRLTRQFMTELPAGACRAARNDPRFVAGCCSDRPLRCRCYVRSRPHTGAFDASDFRRKALPRRAFRPFLRSAAEHPRRTAGGRALDRHAARRGADPARRHPALLPLRRRHANHQVGSAASADDRQPCRGRTGRRARADIDEQAGIARCGVPALEAAPTVAHVIAWRDGNLNPTLRPFLAAAGLQKS